MEGVGTLPEAVLAADVVEVAAAGPGLAIPSAKKPAARQVPRWEADARDRVRTAVRRFAGPMAGLVARDAGEGDTRLLVTDFLCDGLGYGKHADLTAEYQAEGEFAGYGVRAARRLVAFIEVKRAAARLAPQHLHWAGRHAASAGAEWVILTNGQTWQAWHLTAGPPPVLDSVLEASLLGGDGSAQQADILFQLSKEAFRHHVIDGLWRLRAATSATSLGTVITSGPVIDQIRKELRRRTGHDMDPAELSDLIRSSVLRPDARHRPRRPTTVVCGIPVGRMEDLAG
jgi:hypothetical protein